MDRPVASRILVRLPIRLLPERAHVGALGAASGRFSLGSSELRGPYTLTSSTDQSAQTTSQARYSLRTKRTMIGMPGEAMNL